MRPSSASPAQRSGAAGIVGHEAAKELADYIAGRPVVCYDKGTGTNGCMVGQCFVGSNDIAGWMARNGWVCSRRSDTRTHLRRVVRARLPNRHLSLDRGRGAKGVAPQLLTRRWLGLSQHLTCSLSSRGSLSYTWLCSRSFCSAPQAVDLESAFGPGVPDNHRSG